MHHSHFLTTFTSATEQSPPTKNLQSPLSTTPLPIPPITVSMLSFDRTPDHVHNYFIYLNRTNMKTISTLLTLAIILTICASSAVLYLNQSYNSSALLTLVWIVGSAVWIKANGFFEDKNVSVQ